MVNLKKCDWVQVWLPGTGVTKINCFFFPPCSSTPHICFSLSLSYPRSIYWSSRFLSCQLPWSHLYNLCLNCLRERSFTFCILWCSFPATRKSSAVPLPCSSHKLIRNYEVVASVNPMLGVIYNYISLHSRMLIWILGRDWRNFIFTARVLWSAWLLCVCLSMKGPIGFLFCKIRIFFLTKKETNWLFHGKTNAFLSHMAFLSHVSLS